MDTQQFKQFLNEHHSELIILDQLEDDYLSSNQILNIQDRYGLIKISVKNLYRGSKPNINSAINKTEYFINKSLDKHGNKFLYDKINYIDFKTDVLIGCNICKTYFYQKPTNHLKNCGNNFCPTCPNSLIKEKVIKPKSKVDRLSRRKTTDDFVKKAKLKHNLLYDYSESRYIKKDVKLKIRCIKHNHIFEQTPNSHLRGSGCPICGKENSGWNRSNFKEKCIKHNNGFGILYVIRCFNDNEEFYKIGRTSQSIKKRFNNKNYLPYKYEIIQEIIDYPEVIFNLENSLHRLYKNYSYIPNINFKGKTECYKL